MRSWTRRGWCGLVLFGLLVAVPPSAAAAAPHGRALHAPVLETQITTTTVVSDLRAPRTDSKCPPGTSLRALCELVPIGLSPKAKARRKRSAAKPPGGTAAAPSGSTPVTSPAGVGFPEGLPRVPPVSPLQSTALNLLLGVFPVPPFLLPIYHAAAIDYGVPWQILAAINEIETDYGRNLSTSPAGAVGWMQFLPSTWATFGVDADGDGVANPYDPIDAIFSAARYLRAAGADRDLSRAVFAYNHAGWYVSSVELRGSLLRFLPQRLVDVLTGLMQARFPIGGHLGPYARQLPARVRVGSQPGVVLNAPPGAPVIASADGRVVAIGHDPRRGRYVAIMDSYGDRFTYTHLGQIEAVYPVLRPRLQSAIRIDRALDAGSVRGARIPAATRLLASAPASRAARAVRQPIVRPQSAAIQFVPMVKERLFAQPSRPASYAAGGQLQLQSELAADTARAGGAGGQADYYSTTVRLAARAFALAPLTRGSVVLAGTILGRVGRPAHGPGQIVFQIRPAGASAPVDPGPIVAGWQLLGKLTAGRPSVAGAVEAGAYGSANPWVGQLLMARAADLKRAVLADPRVTLDSCGRRAIRAGRVDPRVLDVVEYLSYAGLRPAISGLPCPVAARARSAPDLRFDITELAGIPVAGHQQRGGLVDLAIRQLLALQGSLRPSRIVSLLRFPWETAAVARPGGADAVEVEFASVPSTALGPSPDALDTGQWQRLIRRLVRLSAR